MRRKNNLSLAFMILSAVCIIFISHIDIFAQSDSQKKSKKKDFGSSLERFENKKKTESQNSNQKTNIPADDETVRINTDLVVSDVLVVNEKGSPVIGLNQSDFIVKEDANPQQIEVFSGGAKASLPRSIVMIFLDVRYSQYFRENSLRAAKSLVDKLAPNDKMAIVTTDLKLAVDFTTDKNVLKKTLNNLPSQRQDGNSDSRDYGTLMAVLSEMFDEKDVRPIVIFQTPGSELGQLKETDLLELPKGAPTMPELQQKNEEWGRKNSSIRATIEEIKRLHPERRYGFSDVLERIKKSRATIYSIIPYMRFVGFPREEQLKRGRISNEIVLRMQGNNLSTINRKAYEDQEDTVEALVVSQSAMIQVAALSGGLTHFIEQPKDAEKVYNDIFTIINDRYTIGYYSPNEERGEKPRSVVIEVRGHPEYKIIGRNSYVAPER